LGALGTTASAGLIAALLALVALGGAAPAAGARRPAVGSGYDRAALLRARKSCPVTQSGLEATLASRQAMLTTLSSDVESASSNGDLTSGHASTLEARLANDGNVIATLIAKVPNDTTCAALRADNQKMTNLRIPEVIKPQVDLTISADTETATEASLSGQFPALQSAVNKITNASKKRRAKRLLSGAEANVAAASKQSAGVAQMVLATRPAGYPANTAVFTKAGVRLLAGQSDLQVASTDLSELRTLLGK
jgi:hypothetical protein